MISPWVWLVGGIVIVIWILYEFLKTKCPKCEKYLMRKTNQEEILNVSEYIKPVRRKTSQVDREGNPIWVTEDKLHRRTDYRIHYSCESCGVIPDWFEDKWKEVQVFKSN